MENYHKGKVVGKGAYGTVYLCSGKADKKKVIIKQIPVEQMTTEERQAALTEVKVLSMLQHPNIIEYYENFLADKSLMIVMEYAEGGTLADYIKQRGNTLIEEEEILNLFTQMVLALHHVHSKQILHRDLKTQNVLMNRGRNMVKVSDFGISKVLISKSKAYSVVGTPCYISPELCEGKAYNQKSDIWALGCILYELAALKKAFDAKNLPALIMKIMRGRFSPISSRYSDGLKDLILSLLQLDPSKRPLTSEIMAEPIIIPHLIHLLLTVGRFPLPSPGNATLCSSLDVPGGMETLLTPRSGGLLHSVPTSPAHNQQSVPSAWSASNLRSSVSINSLSVGTGPGGASSPVIPQTLHCHVYIWGNGLSRPHELTLPAQMLYSPVATESGDCVIKQVGIGRSALVAVTTGGRLLTWVHQHQPAPTQGGNTSAHTVGSVASRATTGGTTHTEYVCQGVDGQGTVTIQYISCGDMFTACLTDRGILLTYGSGSSGCLGHGTYADVSQPKIVEALLGYEVVHVSCGSSHTLALTNDGELFSWGRGDNGRLGVGSNQSQCRPVAVSDVPGDGPVSVYCGVDCSAYLTLSGVFYCCGSNRYNKLGLNPVTSATTSDSSTTTSASTTTSSSTPTTGSSTTQSVDESSVFVPGAVVSSPQLVGVGWCDVGLGVSHTVLVTATEGHCYTMGSNLYGQRGAGAGMDSGGMGEGTASGSVGEGMASGAASIVSGIPAVRTVACGDTFTVAACRDGSVFTWGKSSRGRLGRDSGGMTTTGGTTVTTAGSLATPDKVNFEQHDHTIVVSVAAKHSHTILAAMATTQ